MSIGIKIMSRWHGVPDDMRRQIAEEIDLEFKVEINRRLGDIERKIEILEAAKTFRTFSGSDIIN